MGQAIAVAIGCLTFLLGCGLMLDAGGLARRVHQWHERRGAAVPRWIREGPSTFSLDVAGMRAFGGGLAAVGLVFLWFGVDAANGDGAATATTLSLAAVAVASLVLARLIRR